MSLSTCLKTNRKPTRRELLWEIGGGMAGIALAQLEAQAASTAPHFAPKAKHVILISLPGGISHVDTFDYKPELAKHHGRETQGANTIKPFFGKRGALMKSPWEFRRYGQSGKWVSDLLPHLARQADHLTFLHSMVSRSNAHGPAIFQMSTGFIFQGFPSVGSWISYGLGSDNENLPSFVVLPDPRGVPPCGVANWGNGFLPAAHQGVVFGGESNPIADLRPPPSVSAPVQAATYDLLTEINERHLMQNPGEDALVARIKAYELAAKMQLTAPEVTSIAGESEKTKELYGLNDPASRGFGYNCLLARRLIERGVRSVQLFNGGHFGSPRVNWDAHEDLVANHTKNARTFDRPAAGLIADLKQRGLLSETLVVVTTEFGRLPISEGLGEGGRDHNPEGFTSFLAGAGLKAGYWHGATDELGYKAAENPVTIYDFHATILHLLGIDHTRLTYYHNGLNRRLTDVHGHVIREILI
ncbi:MAG: DUF1501 domain-containing protein [Acidobacteria bacterium]|nr:DUF1501 domain-containing protein [Acidobacteriota bacterium]